ncbi:MAG: hypothetical protein ACRDX8_06450 [Acidimicrobiales bacterium]
MANDADDLLVFDLDEEESQLLRSGIVECQMWKAAAIADGRLLARGARGDRTPWTMALRTRAGTPAGYAAELVSGERDQR